MTIAAPDPIQQHVQQMRMSDQSPEMQKLLQDSVEDISLKWVTPAGWQESPGSGMRVATFAGPNVETTIISLGGNAGGLQANVVRWLRQIEIVDLSTPELDKILAAQENLTSQGGFAVTVFDLNPWAKQKTTSQNSMMAAIVNVDSSTVFIKMTGDTAAIDKNREKFIQLCQSLTH